MTCEWKQSEEVGVYKSAAGVRHRVNIIDTPGHVDFTAEVERSLRCLTVPSLFSAVLPGSSPSPRRSGARPANTAFPASSSSQDGPRRRRLRRRHRRCPRQARANAHPILIPIGSQETLRGQIDIINLKAVLYSDNDLLGSTYEVTELTDDQLELAQAARKSLLEALADVDDELGMMYLDEAEILPSHIKAALRRATIANTIVPVIGAPPSKTRHPYLLDAVVDYLPSPIEIPAAKG